MSAPEDTWLCGEYNCNPGKHDCCKQCQDNRDNEANEERMRRDEAERVGFEAEYWENWTPTPPFCGGAS